MPEPPALALLEHGVSRSHSVAVMNNVSLFTKLEWSDADTQSSGVQMHATFWHLMQFIVVALLCVLWPPGGLVPANAMHSLGHDMLVEEDLSFAKPSLQSLGQLVKAL
jgi:hypothetical protein